ncbi:septation protein SepH [Corynebacterium aquilae]|uniref:DUF3071 domain-containing protein n=1 Tax=Corynebacterium aquilae DSM 44791 TaxID=1431546 RepID=A0A1L7CEJ9_9CORY|nr:septation protein SepH [Corynebacterium aquilae]APT84300.1 hypothetical protein CAQU_03580 [Corynebacterium aquilae DSM 44791]
MRELILIADDSDASSLVFREAQRDDSTEDTHHFFLAVTDEVRAALESLISGTPAATPITALSSARDDSSATRDAVDPGADTANSDPAAPVPAAGENSTGDTGDTVDSVDTVDTGDTATASDTGNTGDTGDTQHTHNSEDPGQSAPAAQPRREAQTPDPGLSNPLTLRPREIQERIRSGKTIDEVAEEADVARSRIEPFAHPVLLERARIADMAKRAHPVRDDGPSPLTLFEVIATAFAARDLDLTSAHWDAYRDASHQWVVVLTWKAGLSTNTAEWSYHGRGQSPETAVARNALAADLIDPDFARPVRTISRAGRGNLGVVNDDLTAPTTGEEETSTERTRDDLPVIGEDTTTLTGDDDSLLEGESLLKHPEPTKKAPKRKAVTPHWEDVLLGVRANTKRPRK